MPHVKALGARHAGYGVTVAHYGIVGDALMWTLERGLGDAFTPEVRSAWAKVYGVLAGTMQTGAIEADRQGRPSTSSLRAPHRRLDDLRQRAAPSEIPPPSKPPRPRATQRRAPGLSARRAR